MAFYIGNNSSSSNEIFDDNGAITDNVSAEFGTGRLNGYNKFSQFSSYNPNAKRGFDLVDHTTLSSSSQGAYFEVDLYAPYFGLPVDERESSFFWNTKLLYLEVIFTANEVSCPVWQLANSSQTYVSSGNKYDNCSITSYTGNLSDGQQQYVGQNYGSLNHVWTSRGVTGHEEYRFNMLFLRNGSTGFASIITRSGLPQGSGSTLSRMENVVTGTLFKDDTSISRIRFYENTVPSIANTVTLEYKLYTGHYNRVSYY
tara:strand:+ start:7786 stop:8556 length:771 start_codon:yes stop_codon:yes gene_type:complete